MPWTPCWEYVYAEFLKNCIKWKVLRAQPEYGRLSVPYETQHFWRCLRRISLEYELQHEGRQTWKLRHHWPIRGLICFRCLSIKFLWAKTNHKPLDMEMLAYMWEFMNQLCVSEWQDRESIIFASVLWMLLKQCYSCQRPGRKHILL